MINVIQSMWPDFRSCFCEKSIFGYAWPFLRGEKGSAPLIFMPEYGEETDFQKKNKEKDFQITLCTETMLPLQDRSMERILIIHWLEYSESPSKSLREVWRVLKEEGRILLIVPNRRSLWAQKESTPFGEANSFSLSEIETLLEEAFLTPLALQGALYMPPTSFRLLQSFFPIVERFCKKRLEGGLGFFSGVWVIEASKKIYAAVPEAEPSSITKIVFEGTNS
ncbi:MAG TPA: class I SAM-dependent methyltransferase [Alphaproteobacteria bacterium]|nr:class I SAM-dependent methyltransferase [Alphaproteobacteria bacterium]HQS94237.1 class I SAM-dependent methyltransferase [Alphaproteobacteria bacterium]